MQGPSWPLCPVSPGAAWNPGRGGSAPVAAMVLRIKESICRALSPLPPSPFKVSASALIHGAPVAFPTRELNPRGGVMAQWVSPRLLPPPSRISAMSWGLCAEWSFLVRSQLSPVTAPNSGAVGQKLPETCPGTWLLPWQPAANRGPSWDTPEGAQSRARWGRGAGALGWAGWFPVVTQPSSYCVPAPSCVPGCKGSEIPARS